MRPVVYKLLQDSDPAVRQRVALALLESRDREAVPALIGLLADLPRERSGDVEETLRLVAGEQAPSLSPGDDEDSRRKCRDAWDDWWKQHGAAIDLAKIDFASRRLGYTLVAEMDLRGLGGRVIEYDAAGKVRWQITGLRYVIDAQVLGPDRVLVAEYIGRHVTERNLKGDVLWEYAANGLVLGARRLADGNVFVVMRNRLVEVDKDGKEVSNLPRPNDVCAAAKFRDGTIALLTNGGQVIHLDASGKEIKTLPLNAPVLAVGTNIEALPNGHVSGPALFHQPGRGDRRGRQDGLGGDDHAADLRRASAQRPHAGRQPAGHDGRGPGPRRQGSQNDKDGRPAVSRGTTLGKTNRQDAKSAREDLSKSFLALLASWRFVIPPSVSAVRRSGAYFSPHGSRRRNAAASARRCAGR